MDLTNPQLLNALAAIQPQKPRVTPMPYTTTPQQPGSLNPQLMQLVMQALMAPQQVQSPMSLGAILSGK